MVFFSAQEESEPDAIHAPICVIFNTHTQKGIKKKLQTKKKHTKKARCTVILFQLVEPLLDPFPVIMTTADVAT